MCNERNAFAVGGLVFGNSFGAGLQYHEWTSFISDTEFCFRACVGPNAAENCQHIYDVMGCFWVRTSYPPQRHSANGLYLFQYLIEHAGELRRGNVRELRCG
jgi:hypothetical protein